jgi:hypothetical protein
MAINPKILGTLKWSIKTQSKFRMSISVFSIAILIAVGMSAAPSQATKQGALSHFQELGYLED